MQPPPANPHISTPPTTKKNKTKKKKKKKKKKQQQQKNLPINFDKLVLTIYLFINVYDERRRRTPEPCYTTSSPCEPSAPVR